jgi:hypothetical protein
MVVSRCVPGYAARPMSQPGQTQTVPAIIRAPRRQRGLCAAGQSRQKSLKRVVLRGLSVDAGWQKEAEFRDDRSQSAEREG